MEHGLIKTKEIGNYRIKIYYDMNAICPCTDWDMVASFLWEYGRIVRLSDECHWKEVFGKHGDSCHSLIDALRQLISDHVEWKDLLNYFKKGKLDGYRMRYDRSANMWHLEWQDNSRYAKHKGYQEIFSVSPSDIYTYDCTDEFVESLEHNELVQILSDLGEDIFVKEWSTTGYSQGDYVEGVAFCTKERYAKMVSTDTTDWKNKIGALIDGGAECIGMWMWGDVKGFVLEKKVKYTKKYYDIERKDEEDFDWEKVDSCWGYFMETEELINEIISEHGLKEVA
ncbi:hypothetical protein [Parabacteroides sp.]